MGLSMFWQSGSRRRTADPTQQKIMMFMPIMITVTMLFAPAGLVIYWLVSNIWTIGQQYFTNSVIGPPKGGRHRRSKTRQVRQCRCNGSIRLISRFRPTREAKYQTSSPIAN